MHSRTCPLRLEAEIQIEVMPTVRCRPLVETGVDIIVLCPAFCPFRPSDVRSRRGLARTARIYVVLPGSRRRKGHRRHRPAYRASPKKNRDQAPLYVAAPAIRHRAGFPAACSGPHFIVQFPVTGILCLVMVRLPLRAMLPRGHIGPQDGIHAREMAFALRLEPFEYVSINAQMHR